MGNGLQESFRNLQKIRSISNQSFLLLSAVVDLHLQPKLQNHDDLQIPSIMWCKEEMIYNIISF